MPLLLAASILCAVPCEGNGSDRAPPGDAPLAVLSLELDIDPDLLVAHPTYAQNGPVMFNGTAEVLHLGPSASATVTISAGCEWPAIVSPSTMTFTESVPQAFFVTVVVPPRMTRGLREELRVQGTAKVAFHPVMTDTAYANVTVAPYYDVRITGVDNEGIIERGSTVDVTLNITNHCNFDLTSHLALVDPPPGFSAEPTDTTTIAAGTNAFLTISVVVGDEAATGTCELRVDVLYPEQAQGAPACSATPQLAVVDAGDGSPSWGVTALVLLALAGGIAAVLLLRRRRGHRQADGRVEGL